MPPSDLRARKRIRRPAGCEGYLTRREAAAVLGFASEFKVRELERQGLLRSVRGPMQTAFYPRPEVLALKARLAQAAGPSPTEWSDADLIALLEHRGPARQARTALDLVTETRITIERAEQVYAFWVMAASARAGAGEGTHAAAVGALHELPPRAESPVVPPATLATAMPPPAPAIDRRGEGRRTRDSLIRELRDPDPRVRQQAFERLRDSHSPRTG